MTALPLTPISTPDFTAAVELGDPTQIISLVLKGNADARSLDELDNLIKALEEQLKQKQVKQVRVDLRQLEFMNSSCFKTFVSWLARLQEYPAASQYTVHFVSDSSKHWQQRSLAALSCFAADLVRVES